MPAPPISILLPFKNAEHTLEECLDSIAGQTLPGYELVAVNDHSTDTSVALVQNRALEDKRIRLLHNSGVGLVSALNFGLAQANGELIARMDADDRMHPERLQRQLMHLLRHPQVELLGCRVNLFPEHLIQNGYREYIRWQNERLSWQEIAKDIYIESPFAHPSVVFRRNTVIALGGYQEGLFPEDYQLWLRMHVNGLRMEKLPEHLLDWRESEQRTSRVDPRCSRAAFDKLRASFLAADDRVRKRKQALVFWGAGRKTRKRVEHLLKLGYRPLVWVDIDPRKIGNRLKGVPVVSPEWLGRDNKPLVLCYVTNHGARELISADLERMGYHKGRDYLLVG